MRQRFTIDRYTAVILVLIPAVLLSAWVLGRQYDQRLSQQRCDALSTYLNDVSDLVPQYQSVEKATNANTWLDAYSAIKPPFLAARTHQLVVEMERYIVDHEVDVNTADPGAMLNNMPGYVDAVQYERTRMIEACPDLESNIGNAFPMLWGKE